MTSVIQDRLDQAIQKAIDERGSGWVRRRKPNGRLLSWRIPHKDGSGIEVCIWPDAAVYVISDTSPDSELHVRERDVDAAIRIAEEAAGILQPQ